MRLYLVQHGEAVDKRVDPERPLSDRGVADVEGLAAFLARSGVRAERVMHSGKRRAEQTAQRLAAAVAPGVEAEENGLLGPDDNPAAFDWQSESWEGDALVVGHLPFMGRLVAHLVLEDERRPVAAFTPGTAVCLERGEDGHWQVLWMIRPELLRGDGR
jgi:phosphohistidine phosphatase